MLESHSVINSIMDSHGNHVLHLNIVLGPFHKIDYLSGKSFILLVNLLRDYRPTTYEAQFNFSYSFKGNFLCLF